MYETDHNYNLNLSKKLLHSSYQNDGKPSVGLNDNQLNAIKKLKEAINNKELSFDKVEKCPCCNDLNREMLSEKDRYGFYHPVVICKNCGLIYVAEMWDERSVGIFYNKYYSVIYGRQKKTTNISSFRRGIGFYKYLNTHNLITLSMSILEVGCSSGYNLLCFFKKNHIVKGIDLSLDDITYGKEKFNLNLECKELNQETGMYDLIILSHLFEHISSPSNFLNTLKNNLTPNGIILLVVPNIIGFYTTEHGVMADLQNAHVYYYTQITLENIMRKHGYERVPTNEPLESYNSVWRYTGKIDNNYINDYQNTITVLRSIPIQVYKNKIKKHFKYFIKEITPPFLLKLAKKVLKRLS